MSKNNVTPLKIPTEAETFTANISNHLPDGYWFDNADSLIKFREWKKSGDSEYPIDTPICSPLAITALTHSEDGKEGGLLLQWVDRRNKLREWVLPQSMLADDFKTIASSLQRNMIQYLPVDPKARRFFMDYLQKSDPKNWILYTEKTGWHDGSFVFPDLVIGNKEIVFQATSAKHVPPKLVGNTDDWKSKIGKYCEGNPTLTLGAATAFASPLCGLLGLNGFLVHLIGASSRGKTLSLGVQCSVFGQTKGTWRGTDNAKESEFEARNHIGSSLDELGQSTPKDAYQIVYMVGNGQGKARAHKDGSAQRIREFNVIALSTGEMSLDDFLSMGSKDLTGGLSVRFIQGQSDIFNYGCFDHLHGMNTGSEFATYIGKATGISGDNYTPEAAGTVGIEFIKYLSETIGNDIQKQAELKDKINRQAKELQPEGADAQIGRMAESVALMIVAADLATEAGLTGWKSDTAFKDISRWWNECVLPTRGGTGSTEDDKALEQVKDFFELNHMSHFTPRGNPEHGQPFTSNGKHYGYTDTSQGETTFLVTAAGWKAICKGYNQKQVTQQCIKKEWLKPKDGKPQQQIFIDGKNGRYYVITSKIFE